MYQDKVVLEVVVWTRPGTCVVVYQTMIQTHTVLWMPEEVGRRMRQIFTAVVLVQGSSEFCNFRG